MTSFLLFLTLFLTAAVAGDDTSVMLRFRDGLNPKLSSWSATDHYCLWDGVQCDSGNRVVSIDLASKLLSGTLPSNLSSLTHLTSVFLQRNNLSGAVPSFGHLYLLQHISLDHNQFTSVPSGCFKGLPSLVTLSMSGNGRLKSWFFPTELLPAENRLSRLVYLGARRTSMHGPLPDVFDSFPLLKQLKLSHNNLVGPLPKTLSDCVSLRDLTLANNYLVGSIPKSLASLAYLSNFDVSHNNLSGEVPKFAAQVRVNVDDNPRLIMTAPTPPQAQPSPPLPPHTVVDDSSSLPTIVIIGLLLGCILCVAASFGVVYFVVKRNLENSNGPGIRFGGGGAIQYSLQVLTDATDNFNSDNLLGTGGFSTVFRGRLEDGSTVAVKKMEKNKHGKLDAARALKAFKSEIVVLNETKHANVVALLGYYEDEEHLMLVYEYMSQGTLAEHLFKRRDEGGQLLGWGRRLSIALDIARAVEHIHKFAVHKVVHRDLKPTNILLGDDFTAKVADFGFVHIFSSRDSSKPFSEQVGTFGYWAPECMHGNLTTKADVYSFGVILMELITGKSVTGSHWLPSEINLVNWLRKLLINHGGVLKIDEASKATLAMVVQPEIHSNEDEIVSSFCAVTNLAFDCTESEPGRRPDMTLVVMELSKLVYEPRQQSHPVVDDPPELKRLPDLVEGWKEEDARSELKNVNPSGSNEHSSGQLEDDAVKVAVPSNSGEHSSRQLEKDAIEVDHT
ncbi:hypothetical protein ACLB2K_037226 [Fragaria x ananassa]